MLNVDSFRKNKAINKEKYGISAENDNIPLSNNNK